MWENFTSMFHGIGKDLRLTMVVVSLTALPVYLAFWIIIKLLEAA